MYEVILSKSICSSHTGNGCYGSMWTPQSFNSTFERLRCPAWYRLLQFMLNMMISLSFLWWTLRRISLLFGNQWPCFIEDWVVSEPMQVISDTAAQMSHASSALSVQPSLPISDLLHTLDRPPTSYELHEDRLPPMYFLDQSTSDPRPPAVTQDQHYSSCDHRTTSRHLTNWDDHQSMQR